MPLIPGHRLGPYEVISVLGTGGMGEVYKARDTRLDRTVAVKVLPSHVASDLDLRQRFDREARAISSLDHPHICTLYDIGHDSGIDFLVMQYLEGETLAGRLTRGALPIEDALRCAIEIADGLDRAHHQGIIHRDLKPGNVMLTKSGVKLLDFGLAKLQVPPGTDARGLPTDQPVTQPTPLTTRGVVLGTLQYMAPEQLEGRDADARTDIFAFGGVLYEMLTGRRAFEGASEAMMIAAILDRDPAPLTSVQPPISPALDRVVRKCLAKLPEDRWQTAADLHDELQWIGSGGAIAAGAPVTVTPRRTRGVFAWTLAGLLGAVLALLVWLGEVQPEGPIRFAIPAPDGTAFGSYTEAGAVAMSPDGSRVAFTTVSGNGERLLWVRELDAVEPRPLPGSEGASLPFWSPDSHSLGFFADGKLKRIDAAGGQPRTICDAQSGRGGSWNAEGIILYATDAGPLRRVAAIGGTPSAETTLLAGEHAHLWPSFLPDGRSYLFSVVTGDDRRREIYTASLGATDRERLAAADSGALYAKPGYLLFVREGTLMAQAFSPRTRRLAGEPMTVAERVGRAGGAGPSLYAPFSASTTGVLVHGTMAPPRTRLLWIDRTGGMLSIVGDEGEYADPSLSSDERRVAFCRDNPATATPDIWLADLAPTTGIVRLSPLTFHSGYEVYPVWSSDGRRIAFSANPERVGQLYVKPVGGGAEERLIQTPTDAYPTDWSVDGRFIVYTTVVENGRSDIWMLTVEGDRKATPLVQGPFNQAEGQVSPDGRLLAYTSDESGRPEVWVTVMSSLADRWQISSEGGRYPTWRRDGKELFYLAPNRRMMSVEMPSSRKIESPLPKVLFETRIPRSDFPGFRSMYESASNGQRFLVVTEPEMYRSPALTVVWGWSDGLKR